MLFCWVQEYSRYSSCGCGAVVCWNGYITIHYETVTLQDGTCCKTVRVAKRHVLRNGTCFKTVRVGNGTCCKMARVAKRSVLNNGMCSKTVSVTKRYRLQNGTWYKTASHKTVHVTKRYIFYTMNSPNHRLVGRLYGGWSIEHSRTPPTHGLVGHVS